MEAPPEIKISKRLTEYAKTLVGMEQWRFLAFAEALGIIPTTLAENVGLNPISTVTKLCNKHAHGEEAEEINAPKVTVTNRISIYDLSF